MRFYELLNTRAMQDSSPVMQLIAVDVTGSSVKPRILCAQMDVRQDEYDLVTPDGDFVARVQTPENYKHHRWCLYDTNHALVRTT